MPPLTIYGSPRSRTLRVLWMAAELGLDFEHVPLAFDDPALKQPAFLRINPAGAIPAILDDGFALAESLAINLYLAKKYGAAGAQPLYPSTPQGEAEALRWTLWAQAHLEPWVQRDALLADVLAAIGDRAKPWLARELGLLNAQLTSRAWLLGESFSVADLNVAAVLSPSRSGRLDLAPFPDAADWLRRCYARPAAVGVRARFAAFVDAPRRGVTP
jgi:glutathione S-transferase